MPTGSVVHADDLHTSVKGAVRQIKNTIITHIISGRIANTGLCVQDLHTVLFVVIIIARNCDLEAQTPATVRRAPCHGCHQYEADLCGRCSMCVFCNVRVSGVL